MAGGNSALAWSQLDISSVSTSLQPGGEVAWLIDQAAARRMFAEMGPDRGPVCRTSVVFRPYCLARADATSRLETAL